MIVTSTLVALPLLVIALVARRLRSDLKEAAWRMMAMAMLAAPLASLLPKIDIGFSIPFVNAEPLFTTNQPELPTDNDVSIVAVLYGIVALLFLVRLAIAAASAWKL